MEKQPINFLAPKQQPNQPHRPLPNHKEKPRPFFFMLVGLLVVIVSIGALRMVFGAPPPEDPSLYDPITLEPKQPDGLIGKLKYFIFQQDAELEGQKRDRINVLLLGMGGLGHDGPYLSDTIIIVSLKPSTKEVAMITIPRDLGVKIPDRGWYKINHANAFGESNEQGTGAAFAEEVIENTFDIEIDYHARVDFTAFEEIIDHVGGVTIDVDRSFIDTEFPGPNDTYQTISFSKGEETMSGRRALQFVRSRHGTNGEGSDFARSKRQLKVLLALKEKLLSFKTLTNPLRMTAIMGTLESHITTNVALSDMVTLAKLAREFNTDEIITLTLENGPNGLLQSGTGQNGAYILSPKTGNFRQIRNAIDNIFEDTELASIETNTTPTQVAPPEHTAAIQLLNGTWKVGLASRTKQRLIDKKFTVASIGNTSERPLPKSGIYAPASLQYQDTITALEQTLDIPSFSYYPPGMSPTAGADVIVILGEDYSE